MRRPIAAGLALLVALAFAACGGGDKPTRTVVAAPVSIGTKNFTESDILGQLYKQALAAKGVPVALHPMVGTTEVINLALHDGSLDMYPEYIGVLLSEVDKIVKRPASAAAAYRLAKQLEQRRRFTLLDPTPFSNENALAVTRAFGRRKHVASITDLARLGSRATVGAAPEFDNRFEGMVGLRERYGLRKLKMKPFEIGLQYPQLNRGNVEVAGVFTTDSQLASGRYTLLADPKAIFAKNHVAPLISRKALTVHGPLLARTLDAVSALLTTPVMRELNADATKRSTAAVADRFLRDHGLEALSGPIRVAICDDARAVKFFLRTVLEEEGDMQVVSTTSTGAEALEAVAQSRPDILLLDLVLPDVPEPADLVRDLRERSPATAILLMSNMPPNRLQAEAERTAVDGWMPKAHKAELMRDAVRAIVAA